MIAIFLSCVLAVLGTAASLDEPARSATLPDTAPAYLTQHQTNADDIRAIEKVLETYTASVSSGDKAAFAALLLNENIPFSATSALVAPREGGQGIDLHRYAQFRKSVFESGIQYTQRFYNVRIQQDGDLAQVSLDFITLQTKSGRGGFGWKSLQLVKTDGRWKIASEFYTVRGLPNPEQR